MKKIFKYSLIVSLFAALVSLTSCLDKEFDVDPLGDDFVFSGMAPNPVMRGGALRIFGRSLSSVAEVRFAGDTVAVTEFIKVSKGAKLDTLELLVPLEGPQVGKVTIVAKDGRTKSSQADLTFTEPIEVESFAPATALSGDVITLKGEYLNVVKEVLFEGENAYSTVFESQSRHELKVKVPANAISGYIILSDVNEIQDENTIPNHIYTATELTIGKPTVVKADSATYKSGDLIKVTGAHLDMIKNVALPQVAEVAFTVNATADTIKFNLPPKATDGQMVLTSFAGDVFEAGPIKTVSVSGLKVVTLAKDGRYKAGCEVEITGADLDLVSGVAFEGADADWYMDGKDTIHTTLPAAAKDGAVVVSLESGKEVYSDDIEVVKPVASAVDKTTATAGKDTIIVTGADLDLVTAVTIGDKTQSFIDCGFEYNEADSTILVAIPEQAYSGKLTLTAENGYNTATEKITVVYDMAVSIKFDSPSFDMSKNISFTGTNLMQIEQVYMKGKKVTNFVTRTDGAMAFTLPDKLGPGVYRLGLVLIDGTEMTWPVPFEVTAPYTETYFWTGSEDLSDGHQPYLGDDGALAGTLEVGDIIRVYFTIPGDGWWFEIFDGHWDKDIQISVTPDNMNADGGYYPIEVTEQNIATLTKVGYWGGVLVVQGSVIVTGCSVIHFGASESKDVIWEGNAYVNWQNPAPEGSQGSVSALAYGSYDWSKVEVGTTLLLEFERVSDDVQIRIGDGDWNALPGTTDPYKPEGTELRVELTSEMLAQLVAGNGMVLTGQEYRLTSVALITTGAAAPVARVIWEGNTDLGDWKDFVQLTTEQIGEFEAGSKLVITCTAEAGSGPQIKICDLTWTPLPAFAAIANEWGVVDLPEGEDQEFTYELADSDVDAILNNKADWGDAGMVSGIVFQGKVATITQIAVL